jgi:hypothetical protein
MYLGSPASRDIAREKRGKHQATGMPVETEGLTIPGNALMRGLQQPFYFSV